MIMSEQLIKKIRSLLWEQWDPIGVNQYPEAIDEYDSYAPILCEAVLNGTAESELFEMLWSIETGHMGLDGDESATRKFAKVLAELSLPS